MNRLSDETLLFILRYLGSRDVARASLVNRRLTMVALRTIGWNVDSLPTAEQWSIFCYYMLDNPLRMTSVRHVTISGHWDGRVGNPILGDARSDTFFFLSSASRTKAISCTKAAYPLTLPQLFDHHVGVTYSTPAIQRLELDCLPAELRTASFTSVTYLSVGSSHHHLDCFVRRFIIFPALSSFTGPLSTFLALSYTHGLRDVVLSKATPAHTKPSWVDASSGDIPWFLAALQRLKVRSLVVGIRWSDCDEDSATFWEELAGVTPNIQSIGPPPRALHSQSTDNTKPKDVPTTASIVFDFHWTKSIPVSGWESFAVRLDTGVATSGEVWARSHDLNV